MISLPKVGTLLLSITHQRRPFGRLHLENERNIIRLQTGHVLGRDEDELSVLHCLCKLYGIVHDKFGGHRVEKDISLVHDAEGRLKAFSDNKEEGEGDKAAFTSTEGLQVFGLTF